MTEKIHANLLEKLNTFVDLQHNTLANAKRCRRYYSGDQWTPEERAELSARNQPDTTINKLKPKIDTVIGLERRTRSDPKAFPRGPEDVQGAEAVTEALNYVSDNNDYPFINSRVFKEMLIEGYSAARVDIEKEGGEFIVKIKQVHQDRLIFDPHSREVDFSDADYVGEAIWVSIEEIRSIFPEAEKKAIDELEVSLNDVELRIQDSDTFDDLPRFKLMDRERKRVRLVEMYFRKGGTWWHSVMTQTGFVIPPSKSKYKSSQNGLEHPFVMIGSYIDFEGDKFSYCKQLLDVQDSINKRHSKLLHILNTRQVRIDPSFSGDINTARRELAKPDGVLEAEEGAIEIIPTNDLSEGQFRLLETTQRDMQELGANQAIQGKVQGELSGAAVERLQNPGLLELEEMIDNLRLFKKQVFTKVYSRIKQYWKQEKFIRVTNSPEGAKFVGLNQKVALPTGEVAIVNPVGELNVDIVIDEAPDFIVAQQEAFNTLAEINQSVPGSIPVDILIEASPIRNKADILKRMRGEEDLTEEQQLQQAQEQERQAQLEQAQIDLALQKEEAEIEETKANTQKLIAQAESEAASIGNDAVKLQLEAEKNLDDRINNSQPQPGGNVNGQ